jgi:two-component system, LuxR family, response regulator FixJ
MIARMPLSAESSLMKDRIPTVFVVDDDDAVRGAMRLLLKSIGLTAVTYASADEFLARYADDQPGCMLLDVRMPGMSGLELQHQLNLRGAILPVIFLTGHGDVPMAVEAMQHGAFDFLQKPFRDQDLLERVQRALGKDRETREQLRHIERTRGHLTTLTPREREVLTLMVRGKQNKVTAAELGLSQRTVEIHRARVMEKMAARSLAELVRMTIDAGFLTEGRGIVSAVADRPASEHSLPTH